MNRRRRQPKLIGFFDISSPQSNDVFYKFIVPDYTQRRNKKKGVNTQSTSDQLSDSEAHSFSVLNCPDNNIGDSSLAVCIKPEFNLTQFSDNPEFGGYTDPFTGITVDEYGTIDLTSLVVQNEHSANKPHQPSTSMSDLPVLTKRHGGPIVPTPIINVPSVDVNQAGVKEEEKIGIPKANEAINALTPHLDFDVDGVTFDFSENGLHTLGSQLDEFNQGNFYLSSYGDYSDEEEIRLWGTTI